MTYLIIRQRTYTDKSQTFTVQDHTDNETMANNKVKGYNLANSEFDVEFIKVPLPLVLKNPIKDNRQLELPL